MGPAQRRWGAAVAVVVAGVLLAYGLSSMGGAPYRVPSSAMLPTLEPGDEVGVNRHAYGEKTPPQRGDVVALKSPRDGSVLVLRVVGLGEDVVRLEGDQLVINDMAQERNLTNPDLAVPWSDGGRGGATHARGCVFKEKLLGHPHDILQLPSNARRPGPDGKTASPDCYTYTHAHQGPYQVPTGRLLLIGDNRDDSADSRYGFVPLKPGVETKPVYVPVSALLGQVTRVVSGPRSGPLQ